MMPPLVSLPPPEGDIAPYPNDILTLGAGRWLDMSGSIRRTPFGNPVGLQENTRAFWEAAALRGTGKALGELLAEDVD
jgi:hypothetical protein